MDKEKIEVTVVDDNWLIDIARFYRNGLVTDPRYYLRDLASALNFSGDEVEYTSDLLCAMRDATGEDSDRFDISHNGGRFGIYGRVVIFPLFAEGQTFPTLYIVYPCNSCFLDLEQVRSSLSEGNVFWDVVHDYFNGSFDAADVIAPVLRKERVVVELTQAPRKI